MNATCFHMIAGAPDPVGPFCHATEVDGWVFVTGQMPIDPGDPDQPPPEGIDAQTRRVLENLRCVLAGLGLDFEDVVRAGGYLTHFREDYDAFNRVYQSYFDPTRLPARTCVGVTALACGARVEIDFVARRPASSDRGTNNVGGARGRSRAPR